MRMEDIRVVLVEPEGEVNIGFTCRVMYNFNVKNLYIVNPKVELWKAVEYSAKAKHILESAKIVKSLEEAIKGCALVVATSSKARSDDMLRETLTPIQLIEMLKGISGEIAIMFGRESTGLTREEILKSHVLVTIPANPDYPVLNLSHSVAVILYELYKAFGKPHIPSRKPLTLEDVSLLEDYICKVLDILNVSESRKKKYRAYVRRILIRNVVSHSEARLLISLFRRIYLALKRG